MYPMKILALPAIQCKTRIESLKQAIHLYVMRGPRPHPVGQGCQGIPIRVLSVCVRNRSLRDFTRTLTRTLTRTTHHVQMDGQLKCDWCGTLPSGNLLYCFWRGLLSCRVTSNYYFGQVVSYNDKMWSRKFVRRYVYKTASPSRVWGE